jgi:antitoxin component YwqK of YwqJK toxin-antitoxin module
MYRAGKREGRWTVVNYADEEEVTGFDTYAGGQLNGPHERRMGGKLRTQGNYVNGSRHGPWITEDGDGNFIYGLRDGPWKLKLKDKVTQGVTFVQGKKQGEALDMDAQALRLRDHYQAGVLDGPRTRHWARPARSTSSTATYRNGQLDGREQAFDDSGKVLRLDTLWDNGKKQAWTRAITRTASRNAWPSSIRAACSRTCANTMKTASCSTTSIAAPSRSTAARATTCASTTTCTTRTASRSTTTPSSGQRRRGYENYPNGKRKTELLVDRAADTSVFNAYYESGQLKCTEPRSGPARTVNGQTMISYASADRDGDNICYHPNGKVASFYTFRKRVLVECGKRYDDTGKQTFPGPEAARPRQVDYPIGL